MYCIRHLLLLHDIEIMKVFFKWYWQCDSTKDSLFLWCWAVWAGLSGLGWAGLGVFAKTEQFDKWSDGAVTTHRTRSNYTATVQIFLQCLPIVHNRQILIFLPLTDCNLVSFIMFLLLIHRYLTGGQMYRLQLTKHLTRPTGVKPTVQCNVDNS